MNYTSLLWTLPFITILLSIAFFPLIASRFWNQHYGKVVTLCSVGLIASTWWAFGTVQTYSLIQHALIDHYLPFIILVGGLYIMASDIRIQVSALPTPLVNTLFLCVGTLLASLLGTIGAAMVLVKPFIQMNQIRLKKVHLIVFFIFLVANVGGCLTPVGDAPLFIGFLNGIPFFWPLQHLILPFVCVSLPLLVLFYLIDQWHWRREPQPQVFSKLRIFFKGYPNLLCILGVTSLTIVTPLMPEQPFTWISWTKGDILRNVGIVVLALFSWKTTPLLIRQQNHFDWHPVKEVAKIFAGIFITVSPILDLLSQGAEGPFSFFTRHLLVGETPQPGLFFWATGALSAFLDNAPTYLIFFHFAGGDPLTLSTTLSSTLAAISCGAVFMGAFTYIGNAPNFMIRTLAQDEGVAMPSFFGYMGWACVLLLPLFGFITWLFF